MEYDFFSKKGQRGFNLVMIVWPLSILGSLFVYTLITMGFGKIFGMDKLFSWWLSGLKYVESATCIALVIVHWMLARKWNKEKGESEFGEKLLFIPAEYWAIIPFFAGLVGLLKYCFKLI